MPIANNEIVRYKRACKERPLKVFDGNNRTERRFSQKISKPIKPNTTTILSKLMMSEEERLPDEISKTAAVKIIS